MPSKKGTKTSEVGIGEADIDTKQILQVCWPFSLFFEEIYLFRKNKMKKIKSKLKTMNS